MVNDAAEQDMSEFNAAIATLMRIDAVKKQLIMSTLHHNYEEKFNCLTAYFCELISIMKNKDDEVQFDRYQQVSSEYYEYLSEKKKGHSPKIKTWQTFIKWEIELRNTEQKYGLNMPKKSDPRYAMANRR